MRKPKAVLGCLGVWSTAAPSPPAGAISAIGSIGVGPAQTGPAALGLRGSQRPFLSDLAGPLP